MAGLAQHPANLTESAAPQGLVRALARLVAEDRARGLDGVAIAERALLAARAYSPALPLPHLRDAVEAALRLGGAPGRGPFRETP
ncbi:hypothetical protein [Falsiroseomonas selenitidurans]|uniref:Uncharacterized protein n=1 Tax=Falsiroseomonas selenitidurans TaxID=2716335 RepID=A0ABX1ECC2_9PROT|nr:hypothetical protein [Falsiroseomonas selenitidurans]NKC33413.1 hypothetical protein [Falsiroseomonas selenitidurans]